VHQILATCRGHRGLAMGKILAEYDKGILRGHEGKIFLTPISPLSGGARVLKIFFLRGLCGGRVLAKFQLSKTIWGLGADDRKISPIL